MAQPPVLWLWPDGRTPDGGLDPSVSILAAGSFGAAEDRPGLVRWVAREAARQPPAFTAELLEALLSELVTNAVLHGGSERFSLVIARTADGIFASVTDSGLGNMPRIQSPSGDGTNGRGLQIVDALARQWGFAGSPGRLTVWFNIDHPASAPDDEADGEGGELVTAPPLLVAAYAGCPGGR